MCNKLNAKTALDHDDRYRQLVSSMNDVVIQLGKDKTWLFVSPIWEQLSGYQSEATLNQLISDFFHPIYNLGQMY